MSMLNCFFSRQYAERGDLFEGLSIWEEEKYRELQGTYPVIFISFADVKQNNYEDAVQKIKNIIVDVYRQHRYLEQQECFSESEKQNILSVTEEMNDVTAQDALDQCEKLSPMMVHYCQTKTGLTDPANTILFYRLGDFYEMFFEDATLVSKET